MQLNRIYLFKKLKMNEFIQNENGLKMDSAAGWLETLYNF